jgi:hypothetical protein
MCRSIVTLRGPERATDEEVSAAALQFVRKISGYRQPSKANAEAFERAVGEVAASVHRLLDAMPPGRARPAPRGRAEQVAPRPSTDAAAVR